MLKSVVNFTSVVVTCSFIVGSMESAGYIVHEERDYTRVRPIQI